MIEHLPSQLLTQTWHSPSHTFTFPFCTHPPLTLIFSSHMHTLPTLPHTLILSSYTHIFSTRTHTHPPLPHTHSSQVCLLADCMGSVIAYDILTSPQQFRSHSPSPSPPSYSKQTSVPTRQRKISSQYPLTNTRPYSSYISPMLQANSLPTGSGLLAKGVSQLCHWSHSQALMHGLRNTVWYTLFVHAQFFWDLWEQEHKRPPPPPLGTRALHHLFGRD